jgi:NAD(P)-dependent dehydrogenase (short-subunit alcohol dehydrogenase family)
MPSLLITGASTGIGLDSALRMARRGWQVFACVRREEDAARLREIGLPGLEPLLLDVTSVESIARARAEVEARLGENGLDGLVNNAGVALIGPVEFLNLDDLRQLFEVNVHGVVAVTQAFLPLLRRARGRIVNMSSISGRISSPFTGPYAASKFALEALNDAMRLELAPFGISVSAIEPGMIATPIWEKGERAVAAQRQAHPPEAEALYGGMMAAFERLIRPAIRRAGPVGLVSDAVEDALTSAKPRTRYVVGRDARIRLFLRRLLSDRLMDRLVFSALKRAGR